ncbi:hypothetical protein C5749_03160 [Sphingobacterium gobiense]|uniref:Uncharacterized protein n=2 Tax=Sphingobacterium gobiense TaxID=1382456 RepID=A0A2S9JSP9_9SPHI|nr:hypothetical protein C5749_03160 [Sphingobacterium gobiense]
MVLVIAASTIIALYLFRKNRALNQYVHSKSQAIISLALDDLLLDNLDQLFKSRTQDTLGDKLSLLDIENWWKAGISIPAQLHFFSLNNDPFTFFTIQRINNIGKWEAFLNKYANDSVHAIDNAPELRLAHFPPFMTTLHNEHYVLFRIGLSKPDSVEEMKMIWSEEKDWMYVRNLPSYSTKKTNAHITYRDIDGTSQLFADIAENQMSLSGQWQLTTEIPTDVIQVRKPKENTNLFLSFWSELPLAQTPVITKFLSAVSGIEEIKLINNSYGYTDLFIGNNMIMQQDTIVVYDYDEDFNSIERKEIQEISVPLIESVWKGNEQLAFSLPNKLFYKFSKTYTDSLILLSTDERVEFSPTFERTSSPFYLLVDFENIPSSWDGSIVRSLQQRDAKIEISTLSSNRITLEIDGCITYNGK